MMNDFNKFPNFKFWTQRVLPCVFDESLSYVEKINKLEQMINDLIDEYNKFGQQVTNEINEFEEETNQKIQDFINQVTQIINEFKQQVTAEITRFEKQVTDSQKEYEDSMNALYTQFTQSINSTIEEFENRVTEQQNLFMTQVNTRINTMQAVVDDIPETVANSVNEVAVPWLQANVPDMVETQVAQNVCKVYDLDDTTVATSFNNDANNMSNTGLYLLTSSVTNTPPELWFPACMFTSNLGGDGQTVTQTIIGVNSVIYTRERIGGTGETWDTWESGNEMVYDQHLSTNSNLNFNEVINCFGFATFSATWTNAPTDLPVGIFCLILSGSYMVSNAGTARVQMIIRIDTGDIRFRMFHPSSGVWNAWNIPYRNNFKIQHITKDTSLNNLVNTGIYTTDSGSGVTFSDLPNTQLEYGSFYIQTIRDAGAEIMQYLYNTGDYGASIYTRQKNGSSWGTWRAIAPNIRYEETTNFTISSSTPGYENYYPTSISTIGLPDENIFDGFEVQAIVNIDGKSSNPEPMLYNANLVYNANSPNVITIGFKVFDIAAQAGKFYVKFRVLDWR